MFRKKLLDNIVVLSLIVAMSGMVSGCGNKEAASTIEEPMVIESTVVEESTEIESTVAEEPTENESTVEEETTETAITEEISTDISTDVSAEVEPYVMYTNTNCNIRSGASADSEILGSYPVNTSVEVIGIEENDWSKLVYDGCIAYIKSSLLSDAPVKTSSKGSTSTGSGKGGSSTASSSGSASSSAEDPSIQALREKLKANSNGTLTYEDTPSRYDSMTEAERQAEEQKLADYVQEHNVYVQ